MRLPVATLLIALLAVIRSQAQRHRLDSSTLVSHRPQLLPLNVHRPPRESVFQIQGVDIDNSITSSRVKRQISISIANHPVLDGDAGDDGTFETHAPRLYQAPTHPRSSARRRRLRKLRERKARQFQFQQQQPFNVQLYQQQLPQNLPSAFQQRPLQPAPQQSFPPQRQFQVQLPAVQQPLPQQFARPQPQTQVFRPPQSSPVQQFPQATQNVQRPIAVPAAGVRPQIPPPPPANTALRQPLTNSLGVRPNPASARLPSNAVRKPGAAPAPGGRAGGSRAGPHRQDDVGGGPGGVRQDANGVARYYYPPRQPLPLPKCFYNPTGYVCCNEELNDLIVETYTELEARPRFHTCNVNALAGYLQEKAEKRFNVTFETITGFEDFAQKIHFNGDLVCKVELGGKYMLAYGTAKEVKEDDLPKVPTKKPKAGPHIDERSLPDHHISRRHVILI